MSLPGRRPFPGTLSSGRVHGTSGSSRKSSLSLVGGGYLCRCRPRSCGPAEWTGVGWGGTKWLQAWGEVPRGCGCPARRWPFIPPLWLRSEGPFGGSFEVRALTWRRAILRLPWGAAGLLRAEGVPLLPPCGPGDRCHGFSPSSGCPRAAWLLHSQEAGPRPAHLSAGAGQCLPRWGPYCISSTHWMHSSFLLSSLGLALGPWYCPWSFSGRSKMKHSGRETWDHLARELMEIPPRPPFFSYRQGRHH